MVISNRLIRSAVFSPIGRVLMALLTSILLTLSFPGPDHGWLAWIALVPLLIACDGIRLTRSFILGLSSGIAGVFGIFWWMFNIPGLRFFHAPIIALYLGLYLAVWCAGVSLIKRGSFPIIMTAPALWVALDFLKAHVGFLSLPWTSLAHSQHSYPTILQISSITGEYGVTFLIVTVNAAVAVFLLNPGYVQQLVAGVMVLSAVSFGAYRILLPEVPKQFRVAVVQPCIWPGEQTRDTGQLNTFGKLEKLTSEASLFSPYLIVWPETAVLNLQGMPSIRQKLDDLSEKQNTVLLVGASERVKFNDHTFQNPPVKGIRSYNAAYLIRPGIPSPEPYLKNRLVPFGEYLPLESLVRWPSWFIKQGLWTVAGKKRMIFEVKGVNFGVLICWENLFSGIAREDVRDGAGMLVNLVNDGWFGKTAASRQHNCASVLRAVENGVPVVIASNCGPSQIIDTHGRVITSMPDTFSPGVVVSDVSINKRFTFYTRYGDIFAWTCVCLAVLSVIGVFWGRTCRNKIETPQRWKDWESHYH